MSIVPVVIVAAKNPGRLHGVDGFEFHIMTEARKKIEGIFWLFTASSNLHSQITSFSTILDYSFRVFSCSMQIVSASLSFLA